MAVDVSPYRDEAATLMGQYLLKGYKMLATNCQSCGTVLVQKKGEKETCVLCQEIMPKAAVLNHDEETKNGDQIAQMQFDKPGVTVGDEAENESSRKKRLQLQHTRHVLFTQIVRATEQLDQDQAGTLPLPVRTQLCSLITTAVNTLKTLKDCDNAI